MSDIVGGDPERLEAFSTATLPSIEQARGELAAYRDAVDGFNAAGPNDHRRPAHLEAHPPRRLTTDRSPMTRVGWPPRCPTAAVRPASGREPEPG